MAKKFDEEAIKKGIMGMLEDFKKQGGVLELGEEDDGDEDADVDASDDDGDDDADDHAADGDNDEDVDEDGDEDHDCDGDEEDGDAEAADDDSKAKGDEDSKAKREKKKFDFEQNSRTIFVGNLPTTFDQRKVIKLFKSCGPIESARIRSIVPEKEKMAPKVALITKKIHPKVDSFNAYVVFKTNENDKSIKAALKMNGHVVENHHIRVDRASRPKAKKETLASRKKSVFVGNLRFDLRDDELINHFNSKVGPVNYVRLVRDSSTGLGKGFGFVVFNERATVKKALELNDTKFKGRTLRVKKVELKGTTS